jgi:hypothetical protein
MTRRESKFQNGQHHLGKTKTAEETITKLLAEGFTMEEKVNMGIRIRTLTKDDSETHTFANSVEEKEKK